MNRTFLIAGSVFAGMGVAIGAFGAHGLQKLTTDEKIIHGFQTGVQYQVWHGLALLIVGIICEKVSNKLMVWARNCFMAGIILFSGSLYLLSFLKINESGMTKWVGPITPVGGLLFITGWLFFLMAVGKRK